MSDTRNDVSDDGRCVSCRECGRTPCADAGACIDRRDRREDLEDKAREFYRGDARGAR